MQEQTLWLTVNRRCNIRCKWCYAEKTQYAQDDEMTLDYAKKMIDLIEPSVLAGIVIIGGEPTLWKPLPQLLLWINDKFGDKVNLSVISNGIRYAENAYRIMFDGIEMASVISIKAPNKQAYIDLTGTDTFDMAMRGIREMTKRSDTNAVTVTLSKNIIDHIVEIAALAQSQGVKNLSFEMCVPSIDNVCSSDTYAVQPQELASKIVATYDDVCKAFTGNLTYQLSVPFCLFPEGFIDRMREDQHIITGCHVMKREGVIITPQGEVLLCNCLSNIPIGKYGEDFTDRATFYSWWNKKEVVNLNENLIRYPSKKCSTCDDYTDCCGGCPLQWFVYNPQQIIGELT